jgi:hypothetical protein
MKTAFLVDGKTVTLPRTGFDAFSWFEVTGTVGGDATLSGTDVASNAGGTTYTLNLAFGGKNADGSGAVSLYGFKILDDFTKGSPAYNDPGANAGWDIVWSGQWTMWWAGIDTQLGVPSFCIMTNGGAGTNFAGKYGNKDVTFGNLTAYNTISFKALVAVDTTKGDTAGQNNNGAAHNFRFDLQFGVNNSPDGGWINGPVITPLYYGQWSTHVIAKSVFGSPNWANVTGWRLVSMTANTDANARTVGISDFRASEAPAP